MSTTKKPKQPRRKIVGYLIVTKTGGYMQPAEGGQVLAPADGPVQFPKRRAAQRRAARFEHQIDMLRGSLVGDWPKVAELADLCPLSIQPVHAA